MVIIIETRVEKYNKKRENKSKSKFKALILIFLVGILIFELNSVDAKLKSSTNSKEKSMFGINIEKDTLNIELFGDKYYLNKKEVAKFLENLKGTAKSIKDQMTLVF